MSTSQGTVVLIVSTVLISFLLAGALIHMQGGPTGTNHNFRAEKTEFNQGLKALEIVMKASDSPSSKRVESDKK